MGEADDDTLMGNDDEDTLMGGAGNDSLEGGDDDDDLMGGTGDDTLRGGDDDDTLDGGDGYDQLHGGGGSDRVYADAADASGFDAAGETRGTDRLITAGGGTDGADDTDDPGDKDDTLSFERSKDKAGVDNGANHEVSGGTPTTNAAGLYSAHASFEKVIGSDYGDMLTTSRATGVSFMGGAGNDTLTGGAGNDTLDGGDGMDRLSGGTDGSDTFVWGDEDVVAGFTPGTDKFDTSALGDVEREDVALKETTQGGVAGVEVTITVGSGQQSMFIEGATLFTGDGDTAVPATDIGAGDFLM